MKEDKEKIMMTMFLEKKWKIKKTAMKEKLT